MKAGMQKQFVMVCAAALCVCAFGGERLAGQAAGAANAKKRGGEILAEAAAAAGGEALKKVESLTITMAGDATTPGGPITVDVRVQVAYPDRVRMETSLGTASVVSGFDGKGGWFASLQGGANEMPADLNPETLRSIDLVGGIGLYKKVLGGKAEAEFTGEKEMAGQKALQVEWTAPSGKVRLYFDAQSKLLIGAKFRAVTMQGAFEEERRWSEFREVDGVKFPFRWTTYRDGGLYTDLTVKDVKMNEKMEAGRFVRP